VHDVSLLLGYDAVLLSELFPGLEITYLFHIKVINVQYLLVYIPTLEDEGSTFSQSVRKQLPHDQTDVYLNPFYSMTVRNTSSSIGNATLVGYGLLIYR